MESMKKNWKTTALGIGAILGALAHIATNLGSGTAISPADLVAIWTGVIGLVASDAKA